MTSISARSLGRFVTRSQPRSSADPAPAELGAHTRTTGVPSPSAIEARFIRKEFRVAGGTLPVLDEVSVTASNGEFVSIIGPSGCGKSTLFNILAGLVAPTSGQVLVDGREVTGRVGLAGYMPQKDLLLPWKTVLDNTIIGLELLGVSRKEAREEARRWFPRFGLAGFERRYPATLSGGMRQRAALLRTILSRRDILLLDEPFGPLDALTRTDMQEWLLDVWDTLRKTIIFITHDVDEAIYLSDRVYVMGPRPARVLGVVDIPLPRPREYAEVVVSQRFTQLKHDLLSHLKGGPLTLRRAGEESVGARRAASNLPLSRGRERESGGEESS